MPDDRTLILNLIDEWLQRRRQYERLRKLGIHIDEPRSYREDVRYRQAIDRLTKAALSNDPMAPGLRCRRALGQVIAIR